MLNCRDDVLFLTKQLVQIQSIVNTEGEREISQAIYTLISSYPYFMDHPDYLIKQQTIDDERERYNIIAFVKGTKKKNNKTVLLLGHLDTVGIDDFNHLKEFATDSETLMDMLKKEDLPPIVEEHLKSGEFLFGRGALDMKSGLASNLFLLKYYSEHPEELEGNIVVVIECDEEDSSNGILSSLKVLKNLRDEHQFDYVAAINADFVTPRFEGDENRYIYKGTVGKLLPSFYITGVESHVGAAFDGMDPNFLAAELTKQINYNPALSNEAYGEITLPPVSLKQTDLKPAYDVQTALSAYVYYNFFIHTWSPKDVLNLLKEQAFIAFERALKEYDTRYKKFCEMTGYPYHPRPWEPRVFTYEEMNEMLVNEHGEDYINHMDEFKERLLLDNSLDMRMYSARVVEEAWKWMNDQSPAMILFYSSVYSPRVELTGINDKEKKLLDAIDQAIDQIQPNYKYPIVTKNFFPYISDMSFVAISDDEEDIEALICNNPSWGKKHFVNFQDIRDINVPVINIGPYGFDGHKKYERVEMEYSLSIVPNLTNVVIQNVLK